MLIVGSVAEIFGQNFTATLISSSAVNSHLIRSIGLSGKALKTSISIKWVNLKKWKIYSNQEDVK